MLNTNGRQDMESVILVVDDHAENLRLLSQMLTRAGYRVRVATNGERALRSVRASAPDLILLDIMMPDMNGYAVCEQIKAEIAAGELPRDIPILFVSALQEMLDKVKAFSVGGVDYISKPFQAEEVLARVQTHLALRQLQVDLEQQVAELDAFAHTVAHDLKTPLSILTGYADLLVEVGSTPGDDLWTEAVPTIAGMGHQMGAIIDGLLLFASVRKMTNVPQMILDMGDVVARAISRLAHMARTSQAEIVASPAWPDALGYGPWVEEVWANLISNAIKYGGRPEAQEPARVTLGADAPGDDAAFVRFWVRDNGPGLDAAAQARLFTEFERLHQRRGTGHGLGLSIVRRIVERLGGQVGVESAPGRGSRFWFTLPAAEADEPNL